MIRIMLVDDEQAVLDALTRTLRRAKPEWIVETFSDPEKALRELKSNKYNVIVSDYSMAPIDGVVFLKESRIFQNNAKRIILSGKGNIETIVNAINEVEIFRYILKPVSTSEFLVSVEQAIDFQKIQEDNENLANTVRRLKSAQSNILKSLLEISKNNPDLKEIISFMQNIK